jgi:thiamine-monophosphate kinase
MKVSELGERALIERIGRRIPAAPTTLIVGIGDDAAVVASDRGALQVLTTDALVEGIHFERRFSSPGDIGYKALAVNVSDVAAMGGAARFALLSLMLPAEVTVPEIDELLDGFLELAGILNVAVAGGNITRSPGPLVVDVTVIGAVKPRKILRRSGGRPGDMLYVSGSLGAGAAGLGWLRANGDSPDSLPEDGLLAECVQRHRRPEPRARLGALLGRNRAASACIDLSDGLADSVRQLAMASGAGARIDARFLPVHPGAAAWFSAQRADAVAESVKGGDDYELLFAVPPNSRGRLKAVHRLSRQVLLNRIGELTADGDVTLIRDGVPTELPAGYVHF